jgi:hypothetical protein
MTFFGIELRNDKVKSEIARTFEASRIAVEFQQEVLAEIMIVEQPHQDGQRFIPAGSVLEEINLMLWAQPHRSWRIDGNNFVDMIDAAVWFGKQSKPVNLPRHGPGEFREWD